MNGLPYTGFAELYDGFMADAPYDDWLNWLDKVDLYDRVVADVGCGTGTLAVELARRGASVIGIDQSSDMLAAASGRAMEHKTQVRYLCQDMRALVLPEPADIILSTCDSLNYVLTEDELRTTFNRFSKALKPSGVVYFDMLGPERLRKLTDGVWFELHDDAEVWFTSEVRRGGLIEYEIHGYFESESAPGLYERVFEQHREQFYSMEVVLGLLEQSGFSVDNVLGDFGRTSPTSADRVVFVAQKRG
jgi:SAM-dependent methyltransferase